MEESEYSQHSSEVESSSLQSYWQYDTEHKNQNPSLQDEEESSSHINDSADKSLSEYAYWREFNSNNEYVPFEGSQSSIHAVSAAWDCGCAYQPSYNQRSLFYSQPQSQSDSQSVSESRENDQSEIEPVGDFESSIDENRENSENEDEKHEDEESKVQSLLNSVFETPNQSNSENRQNNNLSRRCKMVYV